MSNLLFQSFIRPPFFTLPLELLISVDLEKNRLIKFFDSKIKSKEGGERKSRKFVPSKYIYHGGFLDKTNEAFPYEAGLDRRPALDGDPF